MEIYLIRHTSPRIEKGVCYGQSDIPIDTGLFESECVEVRAKLPLDIQHFYSSPLSRCATLGNKLSRAVSFDERLKELDFGDWELQPWAAINVNELTPWMSDFVNRPALNGESYLQLHQRTESFITDLLNQDYLRVGVVTHAGNIRSFISWVLDLPLSNSFRIALSYGVVVKIVLNKDKQLNQLLSII
jgi:alpha-ribazole phosphatase